MREEGGRKGGKKRRYDLNVWYIGWLLVSLRVGEGGKVKGKEKERKYGGGRG